MFLGEVGNLLVSLSLVGLFSEGDNATCDDAGGKSVLTVCNFSQLDERQDQDISISLGTNYQSEIFCLVYEKYVYLGICVLVLTNAYMRHSALMC